MIVSLDLINEADLILYVLNNNEELDKVVIYQNLENGMKWARKYDDFNSYVDTVKYPEVTQKYRFEEVTNTKE